jgi:Plant transposon protein
MASSDSEQDSDREFSDLVTMAGTAAASAVFAVQSAVALALQVAAPGPRRPPTLEPRTAYAQTPWMTLLTEQHEELSIATSRAAKRFRLDFRLPYPVFLQLVTAARQHKWLHCAETDASGRNCVPLELKLLSVLYLLGSGCAMRTIASLSGMSEPTVQRTLHKFCKNLCCDMYDEWVKPASTQEELSTVMRSYAAVGFPGAVGSSDVTHVPWDKTPSQKGRHYTGKEGFPTIAYEVTVDHTMRVLAVTAGFHGSVNDKTIVRYDGFIQRVKTDDFYTQAEYRVRTGPGSSADNFKRLKGAYLIVDGGYHKVSLLSFVCSESLRTVTLQQPDCFN